MEAEFWHSRWREGRLGFHEDEVNPRLTSSWDALGLDRDAPVFVPLCGKSHDMTWLAQRGHPVLGIELSEIAVRDYFAERGLHPEVEASGAFRRFVAQDTTLLVGDFFRLDAAQLAGVRGVYDRGSLVALPEPQRSAYAEHLGRILEPGTRCLLVVLEYDATSMSGPPFSIPDDEVQRLFGAAFEVRLHTEDEGPHVVGRLAGRGLETLRESVFVLERR